MPDTAQHLQDMAAYIRDYGLHHGEQCAIHGPHVTFSIDALAYVITEEKVPDAFFTDPATSMQLIEASEPAMAALNAISAAITNYKVPDTRGRPDVIEHVYQWTDTPPIGETTPPSLSEVIGCLLRAADQARRTAHQTPAA